MKFSKENLPDIMLIPEFISITGSTIYGKREPNDVDVVIKIPEPLFKHFIMYFPEFLDQIKLKLSRLYNKPIHIVPCSVGPDWDYEPLFDLKLVPIEDTKIVEVDTPEFKNKAYYQELRTKNKEIEKEAKLSIETDTVSLSKFFFPEKPNVSAIMIEEKTIPDLDYLFKDEEYYIAQKKYDGNRIIIFYDKEDRNLIRFISEDGTELNKDIFKDTLKELFELNLNNCILDTEFEIWKNNKKLNREDITGTLHSKKEIDETGFVFNVFDILFYNNKDIHKLKLLERLKILDSLNIKQSTINAPNTEYKFNKVVSKIVMKDNYKNILKELVFASGSEGSILKRDTEYNFGYSYDWIKLKKYETIRVIVLKVNKTKVPTIFNYEIGVRIDNKINTFSKDKVVELNKVDYLHIGRTYNTNIKCNVGDIISIKFHTLNMYKDKLGRIYLNVYEPIFEELHSDELTPDTVDSIIKKADISNILVTKFIEDLYKYSPKDVEDKELLNDYRLMIAWLSSDIKKYSKELIKEKIKSTVNEILKRKLAILRPDGYNNEEIKNLIVNILKELIPEGIALTVNELEEFQKEKEFYIKRTRTLGEIKDVSYWISDQSSGKIYGACSIEELKSGINNYKLIPTVMFSPPKHSSHNLGSYLLIKNIKFDEQEMLPDENKIKRFVVQLHFRGKTVHGDLRTEYNNYLKGWTLLLENPNSIKKPVLTLEDAKNFIKENNAKIDLLTGEFKERKLKNGIIRKTSIAIVPKADEPMEWLEVEGISKPGDVGSTKKYPGVFYIFDKGEVEYGSFKPYFKELFLHGNKFNGRYIIRLLSHNMDEPLPIANMPEEHEIRTSGYWVMIEPDDKTPYILSNRAIEDDFMSPLGYSFLPKDIKSKIPQEYQYWRISKLKDRVKVRNLLVSNLEGLGIAFAEQVECKLFRIVWKAKDKEGNPIIIVRLGPSTEMYLLKLGNKIFELNSDPFKNIDGMVSGFQFNKKLDIDLEQVKEMELLPKTPLNPTLKTWAKLSLIKEGRAIIYINKEDIVKFRAFGKTIVGYKEENSDIWGFYQSDLTSSLLDKKESLDTK